jgi:hypothetical protein
MKFREDADPEIESRVARLNNGTGDPRRMIPGIGSKLTSTNAFVVGREHGDDSALT